VGQGLASPLSRIPRRYANVKPRRGYGIDAPVEITKRFPQELGNLAQNARFPHSHKPILVSLRKKNVE
jgi:hypothetical protein